LVIGGDPYKNRKEKEEKLLYHIQLENYSNTEIVLLE
jgi:hypothetical protein